MRGRVLSLVKQSALGALVVVVAIAGVAYATTSHGGSAEITACVARSSGTVRLIDPKLGRGSSLGHCSSREREVRWNEQAVAGALGSRGAAGETRSASATRSAGAIRSGPAFSGTYHSPNGEFSISVLNSGITLTGPSASIALTIGQVAVSGESVSASAANALQLDGTQVQLNGAGGCEAVARVGDQVTGGIISSGSPTVCSG